MSDHELVKLFWQSFAQFSVNSLHFAVVKARQTGLGEHESATSPGCFSISCGTPCVVCRVNSFHRNISWVSHCHPCCEGCAQVCKAILHIHVLMGCHVAFLSSAQWKAEDHRVTPQKMHLRQGFTTNAENDPLGEKARI